MWFSYWKCLVNATFSQLSHTVEASPVRQVCSVWSCTQPNLDCLCRDFPDTIHPVSEDCTLLPALGFWQTQAIKTKHTQNRDLRELNGISLQIQKVQVFSGSASEPRHSPVNVTHLSSGYTFSRYQRKELQFNFRLSASRSAILCGETEAG